MKKHCRAFSLMEMLLGLTIFSIISVTLYSTFNSGMQLNRRADDTNRIYRQARWMFDRMAKDLENMAPYSFTNSYPEFFAFSGAPDSLSFLLPTPAGLKVIRYSLKAPESGSIFTTIVGRHSSGNTPIVARLEEEAVSEELFIRSETPLLDFLSPLETQKEPEEELLSPHIRQGSLKLSYGYLEKGGEKTNIIWKDSWDEAYLPSSVRMEIVFNRSDESKEPIKLEKEFYIPTGYLGQEGSP